ncbi:glycosyl hydrolase family 20 protein: beta-hexosaminidase or lacto-N-biosidase or beta-1,6-N-acetylglucosaminidase or beta-6-SO3-N-acetylglucosaminidase [Candidatus Desulfosporosinus infrequens]|uniref:beta-N-acetylhexosaminidase n=1 Tax=Candidatus Desulfosporosinus infrequens TaxID=2043169 RepID=A0A2U3K9S8_9FIRM|nr:glycosyl hydrolase family 20 protein: beta-hexosaminidase or lacto-N-biosidase or beta-1,6-N-acetylglucosaminidase or beta-6-SO3-N-acetylglucosaminidase [Candidatus Desulfosporosinus infrequens]
MYLIPLPSKIIAQDGLFLIDHNTAIVLDAAQDDNDLETAKLLQQEIKKVIAITLPIKKVLRSAGNLIVNCIYFEYDNMDIGKEAYRLTVRPDKIAIIACSNRGFLYGAATLIQLCKITRGEIGCVDIDDEPSYANRGYMLDVSRGRVPTMDSLKALIDRLALYKINQLQLYMENCLRLDGFEEIWSQTDPFTPEEILELDCYCNIRGVELVPCVATFGHLYDLLRSESFGKYREMDTGHGETFTWYNRMRYHILNVADPESFTLIKGILDQYLPLFRSNKINICCDETFDLGKGKSACLAQEMDYGEMYLFYVNQLVGYLQSKGKEVMIWGDIVKCHPEHLAKLNAQVTCLNWYYDYGANEETVKIFSDKGLKQYVCPSVSGYSRLVNAYDMSFINIREMAKLGNQYHADGFLNTDWGDCGHINMPALAIPGMIYGAAQGWNVVDDRDFSTIDQAVSLVEYEDPGKNLVGLLRELSHQDIITFNDLAFFRDYKVYNQTYNDCGISLYEKAKAEMMQVSEDQLKTAVTKCAEIFNCLKQNNMGSYADRQEEMLEYYLAARGVALMQELTLNIKVHEYGQKVHALDAPHELAGKLEYWLMDYCTSWRTSSRESELYRIKEFIGQICSILRKYEARALIDSTSKA